MDDSKKIFSSLLSFETRISLIALLAVIFPLGIFAFVSLQRSSEALTEAIADGLEGKAVLVARHLDNFLDKRVTDARILSQVRAPLKPVLFCDGGVSRVLKSSCIRPFTPIFRAELPCPHEKCRFLEVPLTSVLSADEGGTIE